MASKAIVATIKVFKEQKRKPTAISKGLVWSLDWTKNISRTKGHKADSSMNMRLLWIISRLKLISMLRITKPNRT